MRSGLEPMTFRLPGLPEWEVGALTRLASPTGLNLTPDATVKAWNPNHQTTWVARMTCLLKLLTYLLVQSKNVLCESVGWRVYTNSAVSQALTSADSDTTDHKQVGLPSRHHTRFLQLAGETVSSLVFKILITFQ